LNTNGVLDVNAKTFKIDGKAVELTHDFKNYTSQNIILNSNGIKPYDIIRYYGEISPSLLRATDSQLKYCLPADLPKIFTIDKFHYKFFDFYSQPAGGIKPSSYETFQLIAKILVTKDTTLWRPQLNANNDWRNYPRAGSL
jgi:hypothetical protein